MKYYSVTLLALMSILTIGTPAYSQEVKLDLGSVINGIFSPPHRTAEINARAEVEKEQIRANVRIKEVEAQVKIEEIKSKNNIDPNLALIQSWELTPISCTSGGQIVTIMIDSKQYCVNSHPDLTARSYQYNRSINQLEILSSQPIFNPKPTFQPGLGL